MTISKGACAVIFLLLLPAGCAMSPGLSRQGVVAAFAEDYLGQDRYRIRVVARHGTRAALLERHAVRRAAQLAKLNGAVGFSIDQRLFLDHVYAGADPTGRVRVTYQPGYDAWRKYWRFYRYGLGLEKMDSEPTWLLSDPHAGRYRRVEFDLVVTLRRQAGARVIDAANCLESKHPGCF